MNHDDLGNYSHTYVKSLEKDAARYRWIRSQEADASELEHLIHTTSDEEFDAAIDEAMGESK
jgi:hypothetical protein